jgi:ribosomal protein L37AE/L43A
MTTETRTTIQPEDIRAIEIECAKCHSKVVRRLDNWGKEIVACQSCGEVWIAYQDLLDRLPLLATQIRKFYDLETGERKAPFSVRFEIRNPDGK